MDFTNPTVTGHSTSTFSVVAPHSAHRVAPQQMREERRSRTASARRGPASIRPSPAAPYVDARFVDALSAPVVPPLDFSQLRNNGDFFPVAKVFQRHHRPSSEATTTAEKAAGQEVDLHDGDLEVVLPGRGRPGLSQDNDRHRHMVQAASSPVTLLLDDSPLAFVDSIGLQRGITKEIATSLQQPGLSQPKPPDIPLPGLRTVVAAGRGPTSSERESLSARLARLTGVGNSGRVVPLELV